MTLASARPMLRVLVAALAAAGTGLAQTPAIFPRLAPVSVLAQAPGGFQLTGGFGTTLASPGDIDGSGADDCIVGEPLASAPGLLLNGRVTAFDGATGNLLWVLNGATPNEQLGSGLTSFADTDGDGVREFALTTVVPGMVIVRIYAGTLAPGAATPALIAQATLGGVVVAPNLPVRSYAWRDVSGDGFPEVVVTNIASPSITWAVVLDVTTGATVATLPASPSTTAGNNLPSVLGSTVVGDLDLNGDGTEDIVIGRPNRPLNGEVIAIDGATFQTLWSAAGVISHEALGASVLGVGDVTGDGVPDVLAGAPGAASVNANYNLPGGVHLYDGATGTLLEIRLAVGPNIPIGLHSFGSSLVRNATPSSLLPFPNQVLVGCRGPAGVPAGQATPVGMLVTVDQGIDIPLNEAPLFVVDGAAAGNSPASVVDAIGDVNGDGTSDFVIGVAPGFGTSPTLGSVHFFPMPGNAFVGSGPPATHTLSLAPSQAGNLIVFNIAGGTPFGPGFLAASFARAVPPLPVAGGLVHLDVFDPSFGLYVAFQFTSAGTRLFSTVAAYQLPIAGLTAYLQAFELNPTAPQGVFFSNALQITF